MAVVSLEGDAPSVGIGHVLEAQGVVLEVGVAVCHAEINKDGRGDVAAQVKIVLVPPVVVFPEGVPQQMVVLGQVVAELPTGAVQPLRHGKCGGEDKITVAKLTVSRESPDSDVQECLDVCPVAHYLRFQLRDLPVPGFVQRHELVAHEHQPLLLRSGIRARGEAFQTLRLKGSSTSTSTRNFKSL